MSSLLETGEITVEGRLVDASNATLFVSITAGDDSTKAIYKPVAGERPLWDFPDGNLANRERAAFLIDRALGFNHVPKTILRDGPFGIGMVQQWIDIDEDIDLEHFFRGDDPQLREVALFDAVINNTDRKIGHLIPEKGGHLYICDHGVTFHEEDKLRTVLWQWAGQRLTAHEIATLQSLHVFVESQDAEELQELLTQDEISALKSRMETLISTSLFPEPNPEWPHIPWPPF
ncbi:MAG: SCO1664 family protein [Candidatus Planktophila sp.]|jgi:uncharacterized repeat protein (TIGR03843 family)|nr:SCO1664 family protein [Candidatus Planktophila sp.]MBP7902673.1 SCO1664 family protein [Candidatus Planktophila sp.]